MVEGSGGDFVAALKMGDAAHEQTRATVYGPRGDSAFLRGVHPPPVEVLEAARSRHCLTPFFLPSPEREWEYAVVIVAPDASFLVDSRQMPLVTTLLVLDPLKLLRQASAMA